MADLSEFQRRSYLEQCVNTWQEMAKLDEEYAENRKALKKQFAELIENGRLEADLQVSVVAEKLGVTRQTIHKVITDIYGVRDFAKARAGQIGHENRRNNAQTTQN